MAITETAQEAVQYARKNPVVAGVVGAGVLGAAVLIQRSRNAAAAAGSAAPASTPVTLPSSPVLSGGGDNGGQTVDQSAAFTAALQAQSDTLNKAVSDLGSQLGLLSSGNDAAQAQTRAALDALNRRVDAIGSAPVGSVVPSPAPTPSPTPTPPVSGAPAPVVSPAPTGWQPPSWLAPYVQGLTIPGYDVNHTLPASFAGIGYDAGGWFGFPNGLRLSPDYTTHGVRINDGEILLPIAFDRDGHANADDTLNMIVGRLNALQVSGQGWGASGSPRNPINLFIIIRGVIEDQIRSGKDPRSLGINSWEWFLQGPPAVAAPVATPAPASPPAALAPVPPPSSSERK